MKIPYRCPVCNGYRTVQKPPYIAGDQETWAAASTEPYPCPACNGTGLIWDVEGDQETWGTASKEK